MRDEIEIISDGRTTWKVENESAGAATTTKNIRKRAIAESANDYNNAAYASLLQVPASEEARRLGHHLSYILFPLKDKRGRGRPSNRSTRENAALAFVADILDASKVSRGRWVFRSLSAGSFSREDIGYRAFRDVIKGPEDCRLYPRIAWVLDH
jgi:hypothetical protein